jgi:serine protease AprX
MLMLAVFITYPKPGLAAESFRDPGPDRGAFTAMWVCLRDKPANDGTAVEWPAWGELRASADTDRPVNASYIERIERQGIAIRMQSRWLNAVSVEASEQQVRWLQQQSFVTRVRPVARMVSPQVGPVRMETADAGKRQNTVQDIDYGDSFQQLSRIRVTVLHGLGYRGAGVRVGVLDSGFNFQDHPVFAQLRVRATRDFVNGDDIVWDETGQPETGDETRSDQNGHGTRVLSLLAAQADGIMIGAAPEADYILAKVEDLVDELPVEEDRWIAGLEWADSLGAQVINSSLGYTTWDDGSGYTYSELDGQTAPTSIVAGLAAQRGIVIVNAAGNDGDNAWRYVSVPADAEDVITVGSVNVFDLEIDSSSSRGPTPDGRIKPDLVAPGADVVVAHSGGGYGRARGTSLAAPLVAGTCALLAQIHPEWSPGEVAQALRQTARDLGEAGPDTAYGYGLVDAEAASGLNVTIPDQSAGRTPFPNPLRFSASGGTLFFPLALSVPDEVAVHIYELSGNKVAELPSRRLEAGDYSGPERALRWSVPGELESGLYIYRVSAGTLSHTGKFALIRAGE